MFRQKKNIHENAQTILEYTIILGIVSVVIINMSMMVKRFTQGTVKIVADQLGNQVNGDQLFDEKRGYMNETYTNVRSNVDTTTFELAGERKKFYNDITETETNVFSDLGQQNLDPYGDND